MIISDDHYDKTKAALQLSGAQATMRAQTLLLRVLACGRADALDHAAAATLEESADALTLIIERLATLR